MNTKIVDKKERKPKPDLKERPKEKKERLDSKLLDLARVSHMKAGGRRFRFRAAMVVGNRDGQVGFGVAKGRDVAQAVEKATRLAKKKLIIIPRVQGTIPHWVEAKFSSGRVLLKPQVRGRGLVAGGVVRIICDLAGIKDISSKNLGRSKNKLNIAMATIKALKNLREHAITST